MMNSEIEYDLLHFLSTQDINHGPYWSDSDGGTAKGSPFSPLEVGIVLSEIGYDKNSEVIQGICSVLLQNYQNDGRIRTFIKGSLYPCQTANALRTLCYLGKNQDERVRSGFQYLLNIQQEDGGWRCNASKFGKGPETVWSNPGTTLTVLDGFRFTEHLNTNEHLDRGVVFLLNHWETKLPLGPCHYGIGSRFMKIEYPMTRYSLFHYVYTLSFYARAKTDPRFLEAFHAITSTLKDNSVVVETTHKKLEPYPWFKPGKINTWATIRYRQICANLGKCTKACNIFTFFESDSNFFRYI